MRRGARFWATLGSVALVAVLTALDQTVVATALPHMISELRGATLLGWVFTAYFLSATATVTVAGKLADLFGRRSVFGISIGIFLVGSLLCGLATSMPLLVVFRALQGIGAGSINTLSFVVMGDLFSPRERGKWQAVNNIGFATASAIGPSVGGVLSDNVSWRWIFLVNVPLCLITLGVAWYGLSAARRLGSTVLLRTDEGAERKLETTFQTSLVRRPEASETGVETTVHTSVPGKRDASEGTLETAYQTSFVPMHEASERRLETAVHTSVAGKRDASEGTLETTYHTSFASTDEASERRVETRVQTSVGGTHDASEGMLETAYQRSLEPMYEASERRVETAVHTSVAGTRDLSERGTDTTLQTYSGNLHDERVRPRIDWAGAVLCVVGVVAMLLALTWGGREFAWSSPQIVALLLVTALSAGLLWRVERTAPDPLIPSGILRGDVAPYVCLGFFGTFFVWFTMILLAPLRLQLVQGSSATEAGALLTPGIVLSPIAAFGAGQLLSRTGRCRTIARVGSVLQVIGLCMLLVVPTGLAQLWVLLSFAVVGIGTGFTAPTMMIAFQNSLPHGRLGAGMGLASLFRQLGASIGTTIVGAIVGGSAAVAVSAAIDFAVLVQIAAGALVVLMAWLMADPPLGTSRAGADAESPTRSRAWTRVPAER